MGIEGTNSSSTGNRDIFPGNFETRIVRPPSGQPTPQHSGVHEPRQGINKLKLANLRSDQSDGGGGIDQRRGANGPRCGGPQIQLTKQSPSPPLNILDPNRRNVFVRKASGGGGGPAKAAQPIVDRQPVFGFDQAFASMPQKDAVINSTAGMFVSPESQPSPVNGKPVRDYAWRWPNLWHAKSTIHYYFIQDLDRSICNGIASVRNRMLMHVVEPICNTPEWMDEPVHHLLSRKARYWRSNIAIDNLRDSSATNMQGTSHCMSPVRPNGVAPGGLPQWEALPRRRRPINAGNPPKMSIYDVDDEIDAARTSINQWNGRGYAGSATISYCGNDNTAVDEASSLEADVAKTIFVLELACANKNAEFKALLTKDLSVLEADADAAGRVDGGPLLALMAMVSHDRQRLRPSSPDLKRQFEANTQAIRKIAAILTIVKARYHCELEVEDFSALAAQVMIDHEALLSLVDVPNTTPKPEVNETMAKRKQSIVHKLRQIGFVSYSHLEEIVNSIGDMSSGLSSKNNRLNFVLAGGLSLPYQTDVDGQFLSSQKGPFRLLFDHLKSSVGWLPPYPKGTVEWAAKISAAEDRQSTHKPTKQEIADSFAQMVLDLKDGQSIRLAGSSTYGIRPEAVGAFSISAVQNQPFVGFTASCGVEWKRESYVKFKRQGERIIVSFGQYNPRSVDLGVNVWTGFKPLYMVPGTFGENFAVQTSAGAKVAYVAGDEDILNLTFNVDDDNQLPELVFDLLNGRPVDPLDIVTMGLQQTVEHFAQSQTKLTIAVGPEASLKLGSDTSETAFQTFLSPAGLSASVTVIDWTDKKGHTTANGAYKAINEKDYKDLRTHKPQWETGLRFPLVLSRIKGTPGPDAQGPNFDDRTAGPSISANSGLSITLKYGWEKWTDRQCLQRGKAREPEKISVKRPATEPSVNRAGSSRSDQARGAGSLQKRDMSAADRLVTASSNAPVISATTWDVAIPRVKHAILNPAVIEIYAGQETAPEVIAATSLAPERVRGTVEKAITSMTEAVGNPGDFLPKRKSVADEILVSLSRLAERRAFLDPSDRAEILLEATRLRQRIEREKRNVGRTDMHRQYYLTHIQREALLNGCKALIEATQEIGGDSSWSQKSTDEQYLALSQVIEKTKGAKSRHHALVDAISFTTRENIDKIKGLLRELANKVPELKGQCEELMAKSDFLSADDCKDVRMKIGKMRREYRQSWQTRIEDKLSLVRMRNKRDAHGKIIYPRTPYSRFRRLLFSESTRIRMSILYRDYRLLRWPYKVIAFIPWCLYKASEIFMQQLLYLVLGRRDLFTPSGSVLKKANAMRDEIGAGELDKIFDELEKRTQPKDTKLWPARVGANFITAEMKATPAEIKKWTEARFTDAEVDQAIKTGKVGTVKAFAFDDARKRSTGFGWDILLKLWTAASLEMVDRRVFTIPVEENAADTSGQ